MSVILKRPNTNATEINFSCNDLIFQITISYLFELELYINNIFRSLNQNAENNELAFDVHIFFNYRASDNYQNKS